MKNRRDRKIHPSYALLNFSRISRGGGTALFGSNIKHSNTITLEIAPAEVERELNRDWYFRSGNEYIQIEMSENQFAEAITSMNMGAGVPVTLRYKDGEPIEPDNTFHDRRTIHKRELKESLRETKEEMERIIQEVEGIIGNKKTLSKSDKEKILSSLHKARGQYESSIPFAQDQFEKAMDLKRQWTKLSNKPRAR